MYQYIYILERTNDKVQEKKVIIIIDIAYCIIFIQRAVKPPLEGRGCQISNLTAKLRGSSPVFLTGELNLARAIRSALL